MSTELTVVHEDNLRERSRDEIETGLRYWFDVANNLKNVQDELAKDLETALNACQHYQGVLATNTLPDPNIVAVRNLLNKYGMSYVTPQRIFKVFVDGVEITNHPDSIEGDAIEVETLELTGEEYYGVQTVELIQDGSGEFHLVPHGEEVAPDVDVLAEGSEPEEPVEPESREWLKEHE